MELNFEDKKKRLFDSLASAEQNLAGTNLEQKETVEITDFVAKQRTTAKIRKLEVVGRKHKESIFKRPELPIEKCLPVRKRPDYQVHPNKWKHYSLEDVDTSDHTNKQAAFSFLREIEDRKQSEEEDSHAKDDEGSQPSKIEFKKSVKFKKQMGEISSDSAESSKKITGNKFVMPEYVIGQKSKSEKSTKRIKPTKNLGSSSKQLKLDHLLDEEDENEDS